MLKGFPGGDKWLWPLLGGPVLGLLAISIYALGADTNGKASSVFAVALLTAAAAFAAGGLLGFLFGIPRSLSSEAAPIAGRPATTTDDATSAQEVALSRTAGSRASRYGANTNLEQISDWLTKILVGVGLVQLGRLMSAGRELVDGLEPALGGGDFAAGFGVSILVLYAVTGFMAGYLFARVFLGLIFAQADELMDDVVNRVEERRSEQEGRDVTAKARVRRQLDAEGIGAGPTQDELNEAVAAASRSVRQELFYTARARRQQGSPEQIARTVPVFRALVAADANGEFHRNHAQLGYALREQADPDFDGAIAALDKAIEIRDKRNERGFRIYELNRALARIQGAPALAAGDSADPATQELILGDLRKAAESTFLRDRMKKDKTIQPWLRRNAVTVAQLTPDAEG